MKKELQKVRNTRIIAGITQILFSLLVLLNKGLCVLAIFIGSLAALSFFAAYKSHKEIIKNDNN
ncbi:MAG: hypothetical protein ACOXZT_05330 [Tissierellaceae bacterium]|jgi:hypothetical protein|nr:hypothetical protein [Tissierellia bacterium]